MTATEQAETQDWPLRPWLLAALLGLAGLLIHLVSDGHHEEPLRVAAAAFLFFGPVAAALSVEQRDWKAPAAFAAGVGLVMAGLAWRAVQYGEYLPDEEYGFAAGVVASLLALPLFQAGFHQRRFQTPYSDAHFHVWNDAIAGAGAIAFTGLSWAVLALISELFHLLKIDLLRDLMEEEWFGWTFSGLAFGAALGTLKNQVKVFGTLQALAMLVLSLLAVPLALGLVLFLLATLISGPDVLWQATRSATPLLLACAAGAFALCNAVIRNEDASMSRSPIMRGAALVLAAVILPLAVFAAVSMGLRLDQYGLAPERLWGLVAIAVACAFGVGYWAALVRGRWRGWAALARQANLHLAAGVCALAIVLALPILDFGGISARNQIARLDSGKVSAAQFDYAALRWDFGEPGRKALARLVKRPGAVGAAAKLAMAQEDRPYRTGPPPPERKSLRFAFADPALRLQVNALLSAQPWVCGDPCVVLDEGTIADGRRHLIFVSAGQVRHYIHPEATEAGATPFYISPDLPEKVAPGSTVEVRPFAGRQVYVDGKPVGAPFD